jgi:hypothetical protein
MNRNPSVRDPALVRGARVSATRPLLLGRHGVDWIWRGIDASQCWLPVASCFRIEI